LKLAPFVMHVFCFEGYLAFTPWDIAVILWAERVDTDQPAHLCLLIKIYTVRYLVRNNFMNLKSNIVYLRDKEKHCDIICIILQNFDQKQGNLPTNSQLQCKFYCIKCRIMGLHNKVFGESVKQEILESTLKLPSLSIDRDHDGMRHFKLIQTLKTVPTYQHLHFSLFDLLGYF
jgi:hypothetical protein